MEVLKALTRHITNNPKVDSDDVAGRMRLKRAESARVYIPEPADMQRRESCLRDPEKALRTYFASIFYNPFAKHHLAMMEAIWERCWSGGDKAVAAPRGDGKTQVTVAMAVLAVVATPIRFPVLIGNTLSKGRKLFKQFKSKFENSSKYPLFHADFPEVCRCVVALRGAPQRANSQHVDGELTRIVWSQEQVVMPTVACDWETNSIGGKRVAYFGLDSAIRGEGFEEDRPDMAIIDDPETRAVAFSPTNLHYEIEEMIDGDVAGLAGPDKRMSRIVLTTIQNDHCYSARVTNPKLKPTFSGVRYGILLKWPTNKDLWDEYIAKRQQSQQEGDKDGFAATRFYVDNYDAMNEGAELSNPHRFVAGVNDQGNPIELDALQAFFNRIADWGVTRVLAELQNDPEPEESEQSIGLTAGLVQNRVSGLEQNELPPEDCKITVGLDIGKYHSHWTKIAWIGNAIGLVIDYGVMENPGMLTSTDSKAVELSLLAALLDWRTDIFAVNPPDFTMVDAGDYSDAVYEFVRRSPQMQIAASKGWDQGRFYLGKDSPERRTFVEAYASLQQNERLWLYNVNTEFWKGWVHERFITPAFNDQQQRNEGSLSLFSSADKRRHLSFAHHIVAEERRELFVPGKGLQRKWVKVNKNNHWLDATALACAGSAVIGIRLVPKVQPLEQTLQQRESRPARPTERPSNFRHREGGWIKGMRR